MSENYYNTPSEGNSKKPIYLALIGILLLINGILLFNNLSMRKANKETVTTLEGEKAQLQAEYDTAVQALETLKTDKAATDTTLAQIQLELETKKNEIQKLLSKSNASKGDLSAARTMIENLKTSIQGYEQQISQLRYANQQLTGENTGLKSDVASKSQTIAQQTDSIGRLSTEKASLTSEKENVTRQRDELNTQKEILTGQVNRASVMIATNITATGIKTRKSGKEVSTDNNKRVQKLKICFDILPNAVAKPGNKEILLRMMSPKGEILAIQALGSGVFTNAQTGEEMQYTKKEIFSFSNQKENHCMYWEQNNPFDEGVYTAEVYHDGYLIGSNNVQLK
ncbi:MAG: hypothetical protein IT273_11580 [Chitinophagales bacterium]|jgi:predicted  nucleic acid-binding Zn-ribbon protein|nr:hypothetical protein [Chitinophagales bacterium]